MISATLHEKRSSTCRLRGRGYAIPIPPVPIPSSLSGHRVRATVSSYAIICSALRSGYDIELADRQRDPAWNNLRLVRSPICLGCWDHCGRCKQMEILCSMAEGHRGGAIGQQCRQASTSSASLGKRRITVRENSSAALRRSPISIAMLNCNRATIAAPLTLTKKQTHGLGQRSIEDQSHGSPRPSRSVTFGVAEKRNSKSPTQQPSAPSKDRLDNSSQSRSQQDRTVLLPNPAFIGGVLVGLSQSEVRS